MSSSTRSRLRLPETGPWYQSAADHRRQRLFHAGIVPLFAAALALVLLLAFPSQDLSNKLARAERSDLLTISYLRAWLSAKPDDWPLRLTLARHLTLIGRYDEALGALEAIRGGERELRRAAEHQRLVVLERKAWSLPEDSPLRAELLAELSRAMRARGADRASPATSAGLIEQAMGIDDPRLALDLLRAQVNDPRVIQPHGWFAKMAALSMAQSEPALAASCYWRAFDAAGGTTERRTYLRGAMQAMRSADRVAEFLEQVEPRLALAGPDRALYEDLVRLALGARRPDLAEQWARAMLRFSMLDLWLKAAQGRSGPDGSSLPGATGARQDGGFMRVSARQAPVRKSLTGKSLTGKASVKKGPAGRTIAARPSQSGRAQTPPPTKAAGKVARPLAEPASAHRPATARLTTAAADTPVKVAAPIAVVSATATATDSPATSPGEGATPQLPFDEAAYRLAYDVFVGNRNLADALRVAESAVRQAPDSRAWRERLAQVAEWSNRSPIALVQWLHIATTTGEPPAWAQVKRLAEATHNHDALMSFLRWEVQANPPSDERDLRVAATYEFLGQPEQAISWLRSRIDARGAATTTVLRDRITDLAQISGKVGLLEQQLRAVLAADGPRPDTTTRLANLLYGQSRLADAFAVLQPMRPMASDPARYGDEQERQWGFWDLHTRLATRLQREDDAILSFLQLLRLRSASPEDLRELSMLAEGRSIRAAADVSEFAWYQHRDAGQLERVYGLLLALRDYPRLERLLDSLNAAQRDRFESDPSLLRARADHRQAAGRFGEARRDLERAIELRPGEPQGPAQLVWLLLAQRDALALRQALRRFEPMAAATAVLWAPFGAAYMALNEPQRAVPFFHKKAREANDYLWWLAYADALGDAGRHDAAWTLRRRAWTELRPAVVSGTHDARMASRERVVALALQFSPSDEARQLLRGMLDETASAMTRPGANHSPVSALSPATPGSLAGATVAQALPADLPALAQRIAGLLPLGQPPADALEPPPATADKQQAAVRELVVSYLMTRESFDSARGWLLSRYADDLSRPAWAQLALALVARDRVRLEKMLEDMPDWLPKLESIDAMRVTSRYASAQTLAFDTLGSRPDNPDAHQRVMDTFSEAGSFGQVGFGGIEQGALRIHGLRAETAWTVSSGWSVLGEFDELRLRSSDSTQLTGLPGTERRIALGLRRPIDDGWWLARVSHRESVRNVVGAQLQWQLGTPGRWQMAGAAGLRQTASELALLRVGASKDHLDLRLTWEATAREYVALNVSATRFRTQLDTALGDGLVGALEVGHRFRLDYPDVTIRLSLVRSNYSAERQFDALVTGLVGNSVSDPFSLWIPASSSQANLSVSVGESSNFGQTRAIRPYAEAGLRSNSLTGSGYNFRAGLTGSLIGADRLTLFASAISAVPGNPRGSRELGVAYRFRY
jgi:tetratricopeptide (TPR) repeat protein